MTRYQITHTTRYSYSDPVPVCQNLVRLTPRPGARQRCLRHRLVVNPTPAEIRSRSDYFGNPMHSFAIHVAHLSLAVTSYSEVVIDPRPLPDPDATPPWEDVARQLRQDRSPEALFACQFAFASPHVDLRRELEEYARDVFQPGRPIARASQELTAQIHSQFRYDQRATAVNTPLAEVFQLRRGVCQDFAHVQLGCLRSLGLAARYVSGYLRTVPPPGRRRLVGADASHAWISVYCGPAGWIDYDATNNVLPQNDHITLAWGRDYGDVCPIKGVFVGGGQHTMTVSVDVLPVDEAEAAVVAPNAS